MDQDGSGKMSKTSGGVGVAVRRKEDKRFLRGRGRFVGDIKRDRMLEVAFLRSPIAHGRLRRLTKPRQATGATYSAEDLTDVQPIRADSALPGFKSSAQPPLVTDKIRHVGELIAAAVAPSRAEAEDLCEAINLELETLPAVADMLEARKPESALLHETWGDNVFLETHVEGEAPIEPLKAKAAVSVTRRLRTARQSMAPIEGRGVVAEWDRQLELLTLTTGTQIPHILRTGLAHCLGTSHKHAP